MPSRSGNASWGTYRFQQRFANQRTAEILIDEIDVPVIVDAGIGCPSHAAMAMEMGADAVLLNTAIAASDDPVSMARAFKLAIEAGRLAFLAGMAGQSRVAVASSPLTGFLES